MFEISFMILTVFFLLIFCCLFFVYWRYSVSHYVYLGDNLTQELHEIESYTIK